MSQPIFVDYLKGFTFFCIVYQQHNISYCQGSEFPILLSTLETNTQCSNVSCYFSSVRIVNEIICDTVFHWIPVTILFLYLYKNIIGFVYPYSIYYNTLTYIGTNDVMKIDKPSIRRLQ